MEKRDLTCIGCPLGCQITVTMENGEVTDVKGNTCPRGDKYAREEVTNPTRVVTSIVKVEGGNLAAVSVKTKDVIPKGKIFDILDEIKPVVVKAPVKIGDVIVPNVAGTGAVCFFKMPPLPRATAKYLRLSLFLIEKTLAFSVLNSIFSTMFFISFLL